MARQLTERDGRVALGDHVLEKARVARERYGPFIDATAIMRILDDRDIVRYPVGIRFDAEPLHPGEFGYAMPLGEHPREGYCLFLHPAFEHQRELWPRLIAYHIPPINYGDIADSEDSELFGASLLGLTVDSYYRELCGIADSVAKHEAY